MNRFAKQIFLVLSSCIIYTHYANATPQLPPLATSDDVAVIDQTKEKPALNNSQDAAADSVNIDQFINDVDKKITEQVVGDDTEELSKPTNSDVSLDNSNHQSVEQNDIAPQQSVAPAQASENVQPISHVDTKEPQTTVNTTTTIQPASNNATQESSNLTTEKNNSPSLLVPAYDSDQPKPEEPKVVLNSLAQQANVPDSFITDELQVAFKLAPDDIEVGELTRDAYLDQIGFDEYQNILWKKYYESQRAQQRKVIESFVNDYDKKFNQ